MNVDWLVALLNPYGRQAWLRPVLVSLGQFLVALAVLVPDWISVTNGVRGLLAAAGVTLLMHVVRDSGKAAEERLFHKWGGMPSTAMLRHRDLRLNSATKARYHGYLARSVPEIAALTPETEGGDPDRADEVYESAGSWLRAQTRDRSKFGLLLQENTSYGFRRNTLALRWCAVIMNIVGMVVLTAVGLGNLIGLPAEAGVLRAVPLWKVGVAAGILGVHCLVFCIFVHNCWVRAAAERYGLRLLEACDTLEREDRGATGGDGK